MAWVPPPDSDLDDAFYDIPTKITHNTWNRFARSGLRLPQNDIDEITAMYPKDAKEMKYRMFMRWQEKVGSAASVETAYAVLNHFLFPKHCPKPDLTPKPNLDKQAKPEMEKPPSYSSLSPTSPDAMPFISDPPPPVPAPTNYCERIRNVAVLGTERDFYDQKIRHSSSNYLRKGKGRTLILNNMFHHRDEDAGRRKGSEVDLRNMEDLWKGLGSVVDVHRDLSANDITRELRNFSDACDGHDFCVVFIMSHGTCENNKDMILGNDEGKLCVKDHVVDVFNNANSPHLQGIPKLFFFQCCRGQKPDLGTPCFSPTQHRFGSRANIGFVRSDNFQADTGPMTEKLPTSTDTLEFYATQSGNQAFRNTETGSWFVNAIANVFMMHAKENHVAELMTMVNRAVSTQVTSSGEDGAMSMPVYTSSLVKNLYLYPGIKIPVQRP